MSDFDIQLDDSQPALVRSTEPGTFFRKPLSVALRALALLGALTIVPPLIAMKELGAPASVMLVGCATAAWFAGQVLYARARRLEGAAAVRFPVVPAMREAVRALAEAGFVWSMTLSSAGLVTFLWLLPERDAQAVLTALAAAIAVACLGWLGLLAAHMGTEVSSALVQIANNTHRGGRSDVG